MQGKPLVPFFVFARALDSCVSLFSSEMCDWRNAGQLIAFYVLNGNRLIMTSCYDNMFFILSYIHYSNYSNSNDTVHVQMCFVFLRLSKKDKGIGEEMQLFQNVFCEMLIDIGSS